VFADTHDERKIWSVSVSREAALEHAVNLSLAPLLNLGEVRHDQEKGSKCSDHSIAPSCQTTDVSLT